MEKLMLMMQLRQSKVPQALQIIVKINFSIFYPNPSNGIFTLHNNDYSINTIQITDVSGKIVYRKKYETWESPINIDLSNLSKGVYFINLIWRRKLKAI
jgi:hypothetical protein